MITALAEYPVAKELPKYMVAKIGAHVIRDARIVCSITGEDLQDYLTRLLEPLVTRDKIEAFEKERTGGGTSRPKKKPEK